MYLQRGEISAFKVRRISPRLVLIRKTIFNGGIIMKKTLAKLLSLALAGTMCAALFTSCGSSDSDSGSGSGSAGSSDKSVIDEIKEKGVLVMGTASGYPPYEFVDITSSDNAVVGIDVALGQAIADDLGVELKVVDMPFSELIANLSTGKCDIAIAGMPETEERAESVDFSDVYLSAQQSIIVKKEDAEKYTTVASLKGASIGVEKGSVSEQVASSEVEDVSIVSLSTVPSLILELDGGKIDAICTNSIVAQQYVMNNDALDIVIPDFENNQMPAQAAVGKGNTELLDEVNKVIKDCQDSGKFDEWVEEYSKLSNEQAQE